MENSHGYTNFHLLGWRKNKGHEKGKGGEKGRKGEDKGMCNHTYGYLPPPLNLKKKKWMGRPTRRYLYKKEFVIYGTNPKKSKFILEVIIKINNKIIKKIYREDA